MTDFSTEFIAQQRALADAATARPWAFYNGYGPLRNGKYAAARLGTDAEDVICCPGHDIQVSEQDADYLIAAANHYPDALAEIDRQTARAEAAERERDALRDRLRWIPVEERLPEDDEWVLGADRCWRGHPYRSWLYHHALRDLFVYEFSHWMPLPEPPEGGER